MAYRGRSSSRGRSIRGSWQRDVEEPIQENKYEEPQYGYKDRMKAFYRERNRKEDTPRPKVPNRGRGYVERTKQRQENFREAKGEKVVDALVEDFRKNLLSGFDSIEEVIKAKKFENLKRQVAIPVSTRGVGFATADIYSLVMAVPANVQRLPNNVTIFMIYRVHLAMVEYKVYMNRIHARIDTSRWYTGDNFHQYKEAITSITICLQRVGCLLKSIGRFTFAETAVVPLFPAELHSRQGRFLYAPEIVYLTNLRRIVEQLSDAGSNPQMRQNFRQRNPIPSAQWGDQDLLLNADDIMPAEYTPGQLSREVFAVRNWIETASGLKSCRNKWFTTCNLAKDAPGNESVFVCNSSFGVHIENNEVEGDINRFWAPNIINENLFFYGTYHLSGEMASTNKYTYPNYVKRDYENAAYYSDRSYIDIVKVLEI